MRQCGSCTLCCKLLPVEQLKKPAGARCEHVRTGKGCSIYATRPWSCREWSCLWLKGTEAVDGVAQPLRLSRPDRAHYVIDEVPDIVRVRHNETGEITQQIDVMQIWVDPLYPDAWEDPALLAMLERQGVVALVRYSSEKGFALFPPSRNTTGQWQRSDSTNTVSENLEAARKEARFEFWRRQKEAAAK